MSNEEENFKYVMPEFQITDTETGDPLMRVVPKPGSTFDLMLPEDITKEQLTFVLKETVEFHYRWLIFVQRLMMTHGMTAEQVGQLFFPWV